MTRDEAFRVLEIYNGWNLSQTSIANATDGTREAEDTIFTLRRQLIKKATETLLKDSDSAEVTVSV